MTVTSQVSDVRYGGDGATVTFPVPFAFTTNGDLSVVLQDTSGQTLPSPGFTAAGAGMPTGGALTFFTPPGLGIAIYIFRNPSQTQNTSYTDHGRFPAKSHEAALDKLTFLIQYLARLLGSAIRRPAGDPLVDMTLPPAVQRAGCVMAFDASGKPTLAIGANIFLPIDSPTFSGNPRAPTPPVTVADNTIATMGSIRSVIAYVTPEMFGAVGDQVHDDTAAIQAALNAGTFVRLAAKFYRVTDALNLNPGQLLVGAGEGQSRLLVSQDFRMDAPAVLNGASNSDIKIRDLDVTFLHNQTSYATLTRYPPAFLFRVGFHLENIRVEAAWNVCDMRGNVGQAKIINVQYGHFNIGWDIDGSLDTIHFHRTRGWPYGSNPAISDSLLNTQLIHWRVGRADDIKWSDCLHIFGLGFYCYDSTQNAINTPPGAAPGYGPCFGSIMGHDHDGAWGIDISGSGTLTVSGGTFTIGGNTSKQSIVNRGPSSNLLVSGSFFFLAAPLAYGQVECKGGVTILTGCQTLYAGRIDANAVILTGGKCTITGHVFQRLAGQAAYNKAVVYKSTGRLTMSACFMSDIGSPTVIGYNNYFIQVDNKDFDVVVNNTAPGWPNKFPSASDATALYEKNPNGSTT